MRLLERRAKALACIRAAGCAGGAGGAGEVPEATTLQRFMSSYARRGDAGETTTIAASTFYSKYAQYLAGRGIPRDHSRKVAAASPWLTHWPPLWFTPWPRLGHPLADLS